MKPANKKSALTLGILVASIAADCGQNAVDGRGESESSKVTVDSLRVQARLDSLRGRFRVPSLHGITIPALGDAKASSFQRVDSDHFRALFPAAAAGGLRTASVVLPTRANRAVTLIDETTRMRVLFALRGANEVEAVTAQGMVVYPGAIDGADLIHRVHTEGTEDYVVFERRPSAEELVYDVDVANVPGTRFVSNTFEFLDASGSPQLRIAPPYVVDTSGKRQDAVLSVEGCSYDTNPAGPWGRPVVAPHAAACAVHIRWSSSFYPLMVDPGWSTTGGLAIGRSGPTANLLSTGKVLVTGGADTAAVAELYDPSAKTFSATGSMTTARGAHAAVTLSSGKVLVVGGTYNEALDGRGATAELYDPAAGTFTATGPMANARYAHTATLLKTGKVLVAGGSGGNFIYQSAEVYDPGTGKFVSTGSMSTERSGHGAALLSSGKVLVAGGFDIATAELYDPAAGTFAATPNMVSAHYEYTMTVLTTGKVLLAGGPQGLGGEVYDPAAGSFVATGAMTTPKRFGHSAALLPSGKVLLSGGYGSDYLATTEIYDPVGSTFVAGSTMAVSRLYAPGTLLGNGKVLVVGGYPNGLTNAELYDPNDFAAGKSCAEDLDCDSGFCVDGVCCDVACPGQCQACDVAGHIGTCTPVIGAPHGARTACSADAGACGSACIGTIVSACRFPTTSCGSTCADGNETDSTCDGAGTCVAQPSHTCNNLACADGNTCRTSCVSNSDCEPSFTCAADGTCVVGGVCVDDHTSKGATGTPTDCTPYKCGLAGGSCFNSCRSVDDCLSPNVCNPTGQCVALDGTSPGSSESGSGGPSGSGGCQLSTVPSSNLGWPLVGLLAVVCGVSRRRLKRFS